MTNTLRRATLLLGFAAVLAAGCSGKGVPINPPTPLESFGAELKITPSWTRDLGDGNKDYYLKLRPMTDGDRVFFASHGGQVMAMDSQKGTVLWRASLDSRLNTGPADAGEWLLFGGMSEVIALSKADGRLIWRAEVNSEVLGVPAWHRDIVVAHAGDGSVVGLDSTTGEQRWQHQESVPSLSLRGAGNPVIIGDEGVLVGTASGKLIALALYDGQLLWQTVIATPRGRSELERMTDIDGDLAVGDGVVYAASYQGTLAAVNMAGGEILWSRDISSYTGISIDHDQLYVTDLDGNVWALSRRNGATMWRQQALQYRMLSAPVQQGSYILAGDYNGFLHWMHKEDGRLAGRTRIGGISNDGKGTDPDPTSRRKRRLDRAVTMAPTVQGSRVYATDKRGVMNVFEVSLDGAKGAK